MDNTQRNSAACIVRGDCSELVCSFVDEFDPCLTRKARASGRAMTGGPVPLLLPEGEAPKVELKRGPPATVATRMSHCGSRGDAARRRQPDPHGLVGPEEGCPSDGARLGAVAKPEPEKKRQPAAPAERRILPMQLRTGDRITDETGEWEIIARPYTTAGGKNARVRVQRVGDPTATELRTWGAHERISVKRASAEEGKR